MNLMGIDLGTSAVKVALIDERGALLASAQSPQTQEIPVTSKAPGWTEQDPNDWWHHTVEAVKLLPAEARAQVGAIGIAYQMHGLVLTSPNGEVRRPAIIWSDSRAVACGEQLQNEWGDSACSERLLNAPGNFTAAKRRWVEQNEPDRMTREDFSLLPGEYLALRLTGQIGSTAQGRSEMILWDFHDECPFGDLPGEVGDSFDRFGAVLPGVANELGIPVGIPITYRAGDQPNNAFSLGVLDPGDAAATGGTSGVLYVVSDRAQPGMPAGINRFLHVNRKIGTLMCLNGAGSAYAWLRRSLFADLTFAELNERVAATEPDGLRFYPFGNGAERILNNRHGSGFVGLDFARHGRETMARAVIDGIVNAFALGAEKMTQAGAPIRAVRAGDANLFRFDFFAQQVSNRLGAPITLFDTDGAVGAARGAGLGAGFFADPKAALAPLQPLRRFDPQPTSRQAYEVWREGIESVLNPA